MSALGTVVAMLGVALLSVSVASASPSAAAGGSFAGSVYTMTNDASANMVLWYARAANGALTISGSFATGGTGTGGGLGSQGAIVLAEDGGILLAVNAGSNEITSFRVSDAGLTWAAKVASNGMKPVSIAVHDNLVYVVNAGGNIAGFWLGSSGQLTSIAGSSLPLSAGATPAQISFDPSGQVLVVTEKATNVIDTYTVDANGFASGPTSYLSSGATPFGFAFDNKGHLIVSEAAVSALSSYGVGSDGVVTTISGSVVDGQGAACWVIITNSGRFAYTSNTHGPFDISSYSVGTDGTLTLLHDNAASPGRGQTDLAMSGNAKFLYALGTGAHAIVGFSVSADGSLAQVTSVGGLSPSDVGLAAM
jgi:6-phosphogluconolactonase (cycloisomerase 2 family)